MAKKTETRPSTAAINPFGLRMQPDLRERLEVAASDSGRSLNAEITARLEASFRRSVDDERVVEVVTKLKKALEYAQHDAEVAKAGAVTSGAMVADLLNRMWVGRDMPPALQRLRDASLNVAKVYEKALLEAKDDLARSAAAILHIEEGAPLDFEGQDSELFAESDALTQRDQALLREMNELQAERDSRGIPKARKDAIQAELTRIHAERKVINQQMAGLLDRIGGLSDSSSDSDRTPGAGGAATANTAAREPKRKR